MSNISDVSRVLDILAGLPTTDDSEMARVATYPESHKDYLGELKPSGYRAYHVNLRTAVAHGAGWQPVTCELQIRTLLKTVGVSSLTRTPTSLAVAAPTH